MKFIMKNDDDYRDTPYECLRSSDNDRNIKCPYCGEKQVDFLTNQNRAMRREDDWEEYCQCCGKKFIFHYYATLHMDTSRVEAHK